MSWVSKVRGKRWEFRVKKYSKEELWKAWDVMSWPVSDVLANIWLNSESVSRGNPSKYLEGYLLDMTSTLEPFIASGIFHYSIRYKVKNFSHGFDEGPVSFTKINHNTCSYGYRDMLNIAASKHLKMSREDLLLVMGENERT